MTNHLLSLRQASKKQEIISLIASSATVMENKSVITLLP
jgi:hypothetical protein